MSILNVNTIQPVGSGQTITVSATNISAPSTVVTASSFVGSISNTSGTTVVSAGTTAAPSISPSGDSNTGIFFPSPDTVVIGTNANERIRVGAAGFIGIGTDNPSRPLHINGLGNLGTQFQINSTSESAGITLFPQPGNNYEIQATGASVAEANSFIVYDRTNSLYRLIVDSAGRVKMPYQPGFKVAWSSRNATASGRVLSTNAGDTALTDRDCYNRGNHFDSATGRFTAPVTGTYMFIFSAMRNVSSGSNVNIRIQKNNSISETSNMYSRMYQGAYASNYQQDIIVTTTQLNVNDYVVVWIDGNTSIYSDDTYFAGHLLG